MDLTFENLLAHINTVYILVTKNDEQKSSALADWSQQEDEGPGMREPNLRLKVLYY